MQIGIILTFTEDIEILSATLVAEPLTFTSTDSRTFTATTPSISDGTPTLTITAQRIDNEVPAIFEKSIIVDLTSPSISPAVISAAPDLISPNGDSEEDTTVISFTPSEEVTYTLTITDGTKTRTITSPNFVTESQTVTWDGKADDDSVMQTSTVSLTLTDRAGNTFTLPEEDEIEIEIDISPPSLTNVQIYSEPLEAITYYKNALPLISGTTEDGTTIKIMSSREDDATELDSIEVTGTTTFSKAIGLSEGPNTLIVYAIDDVGNKISVPPTDQATIIYDTTPPTVTNKYPPPNNEDGDLSPEISVLLSDGLPISDVSGIDTDSINLKICKQTPPDTSEICEEGISDLSTFDISSGSVTYEFNSGLTESDTIPITYTTTITVNDIAGNSLSEEWSFTINPNVPAWPTFTGTNLVKHSQRHYYFRTTNDEDITINFDETNSQQVRITGIEYTGPVNTLIPEDPPTQVYDYTLTGLAEGVIENLKVTAEKELEEDSWGPPQTYSIYITPDETTPQIVELTLTGSNGEIVPCTIGTLCEVTTSDQVQIEGNYDEEHLNKTKLIKTSDNSMEEIPFDDSTKTFSYMKNIDTDGTYDYDIMLIDKASYETSTPIRIIVDNDEPSFYLEGFNDENKKYVSSSPTILTGVIDGNMGATGVDISLANNLRPSAAPTPSEVGIDKTTKEVSILGADFVETLGDVIVGTPIRITNDEPDTNDDVYSVDCGIETFNLARTESGTVTYTISGEKTCQFTLGADTVILTINVIDEPTTFTLSGIEVVPNRENRLHVAVTRKDIGVSSISDSYILIYDTTPPSIFDNEADTFQSVPDEITFKILDQNLVDFETLGITITEGANEKTVDSDDITITPTANPTISIIAIDLSHDPAKYMNNPAEGEEATYGITVTASDSAGNPSSTSWNIIIDKSPPEITSATFENPIEVDSTLYLFNNVHSLTINADEEVTCKYEIDPETIDFASLSETISPAAISLTTEVSFSGVSRDEEHSLYIICEDEVGNNNDASPTQIDFTYTLPAVIIYDTQITYIDQSGDEQLKDLSTDTLTNDVTPTIIVKTDVESACRMDKGILSADLDMEPDTSDPLIQIYPPVGTEWDSEFEDEDRQGFTIKCEDTTDIGKDEGRLEIEFTIDTTAPDAPTLDDPTETTVGSETQAITGTGTEGDLITIYLDGSPTSYTGTVQEDNTFSINTKLEEGPNTITATAIDPAGNEGPESNSISINYIAGVPSYDSIVPGDEDILDSVSKIQVTWDEAVTLEAVSLTLVKESELDGTGSPETIVETSIFPGTDNVFTYDHGDTPLANGIYTVTISASDNLDHDEDFTSTFTVDDRVPSIDILVNDEFDPTVVTITISETTANLKATINGNTYDLIKVNLTKVLDEEELIIEFTTELTGETYNLDQDIDLDLEGVNTFKINAESELAISTETVTITRDTIVEGGDISIS
jgi:hypothetical protein